MSKGTEAGKAEPPLHEESGEVNFKSIDLEGAISIVQSTVQVSKTKSARKANIAPASAIHRVNPGAKVVAWRSKQYHFGIVNIG